MTENLTIEICCELNSSNVEIQSIFLLFLFNKLNSNEFLTFEQIFNSTKSFFLDFFDDETLEKFRQEKFVRLDRFVEILKKLKIQKEKFQRKVEEVLTKTDEFVGQTTTTNNDESSTNLRSLRRRFLQAKIPRSQLEILIKQGGWSNEIAAQFRRELDVVQSENSLDLIRHVTEQISNLLRENGSIGENLLIEHFRRHETLFLTDFELLLKRDGLIPIEDLLDLFLVCRLAKANEIESFAKTNFSLNVTKTKRREEKRKRYVV